MTKGKEGTEADNDTAPKRPIPVIGCGVSLPAANHIIKQLVPEIEVIHFVTSSDAAKQDIPRILEGKKPLTASAGTLGSQRYDRRPEAVFLDVDFCNEVVGEIRRECEGVKRGVPWLMGGYGRDELEQKKKKKVKRRPAEAIQEDGEGEEEEEAGDARLRARRIKRTLLSVREEGKGFEDGIYIWSSPVLAGMQFGVSFYAQDLLSEARMKGA